MYFKKCYVDTTEQVDCIAITHEVHYAIRDAGVVQGLVNILIPSPEAGVTVGEAVPQVREALIQTITRWAAEVAGSMAKDAKQRPVNVQARVQSALLGRAIVLPFDHGRMLLDPYSDVLVVDYESKRQRREIVITVFGEAPAADAAAGDPA